ncbi:MAG: alpha/beta fold hydrolase [Phycisphaerales bacterium]|nr:alpha/beta fold hydrolase [Phycisphaerales bacterium]
MIRSDVEIDVPDVSRAVDAVWQRPDDARLALVLAHGAGAGMHHPFMTRLADALTERAVAVLRYQFPYMQAGSRRPDPPRTLVATVRAAVDHVAHLAPDLPRFAGGKSMGGRMTTTAAAAPPGLDVRGLVCVGFPLHPAKRPGTGRATHLRTVALPLLFLQGTRDALADLDLLRPIVAALGPRACLHIVDGADHGFAVLKRSGRTADEVMTELADTAATRMAGWIAG